MTKAESKEEWVKAWRSEAGCLIRAFQCKPDLKFYEEYKSKIDEVKKFIEAIADRMDIEGVWEDHSRRKS